MLNLSKLLFIPGLLCDARLWQPVIELLPSSVEYSILDVAKLTTIDAAAQEIWQQFNTKTILVGFSLGAWIALQAYFLCPSRCTGLVLLSSAPGHLLNKTRRNFEDYILAIQNGKFEAFIEHDFITDVAKINQSSVKRSFFSMMQNNDPVVAINQLSSLLNFKGNFDNLGNIHCPTILSRGELDNSVNIERQEEMSQKIPLAKLIITPNSGHYTPLENPEFTAHLLSQLINK